MEFWGPCGFSLRIESKGLLPNVKNVSWDLTQNLHQTSVLNLNNGRNSFEVVNRFPIPMLGLAEILIIYNDVIEV